MGTVLCFLGMAHLRDAFSMKGGRCLRIRATFGGSVLQACRNMFARVSLLEQFVYGTIQFFLHSPPLGTLGTVQQVKHPMGCRRRILKITVSFLLTLTEDIMRGIVQAGVRKGWT